jgi:hypothetical protein
MSYVDQSLGGNENLLYRARFPWFRHATGWLFLIIVAFGLVVLVLGYGWLGAVLALAGLSLFVANLIPIWTTEIGVTTQRLIYKRGLLAMHRGTSMRAMKKVTLEQVARTLFDFGRLELRGTGVDDIRLPSLADPLGLRKALQNGTAAAAQPTVIASPSPSPRRDEVSHSPA